MAHKLSNGKYKCSWCNKVYPDPTKADVCRDSHNLILVPMLQDDINRLVQFMATKNDELLTETMWRSLSKYTGRFTK